MFKYEMHCHTCETSKCGKSTGTEMARLYHDLGYTGLFITDHFLTSNTTVPKELPWEERIELFFEGYNNAKAEGDKLGLDVFFGFEHGYGWAHLLTYNIGKDWLLAHPDMLEWDMVTYLETVRADGGCVVHAHPFREKVKYVQLAPFSVDAIESPNAARTDEFNGYARKYAEMFGLPLTAGSDNHNILSKRLCGIEVPERFVTSADYLKALQNGTVKTFTLDR